MPPSRHSTKRLTRSIATLSAILVKAQRRVIDPTRLGLLELAARNGRVRPSDAARELDVSASSITRHAQALSAEGKVAIVGDLHDRRSCHITITGAGEDQLSQLEEDSIDFFRVELSDWSDAEVRQLASLVAKLCDTLTTGHEQRQRDGMRKTS